MNQDKDQGAAVRGEAVAEALALCDNLIHTDGATARAVACDLRPKLEAKLINSVAAPVSPRAADALDSQPTLRKLTEELTLNEIADEFFACANMGWDCTISSGACRNLFDAMTTPPAPDEAPATQPTVAAQQGSIADDARLDDLLLNFYKAAYDSSIHAALTDDKQPLVDFIQSLLDSRASSAPVAPIAPDDEPVAEVAESFVFMLRHQPDGERWPVGTKLYVRAAPHQEGSEAGNG